MMGSGYERMGAPEAPVGPRVRVYELAKDLNLQPKDLVNKIRAMGIDVANHMSQIEPGEVDRVRRAVERERHESLVEERLNDTGSVIRRRSKTVISAPAAPEPVAAAPAPAAPRARHARACRGTRAGQRPEGRRQARADRRPWRRGRGLRTRPRRARPRAAPRSSRRGAQPRRRSG